MRRNKVVNMFGFFRTGNDNGNSAAKLYNSVVEQARAPVFYRRMNVPDTVDGRFDMISLHAFLLLNRIGRDGREADRLAQAFFDRMFRDMDRAAREMGIGDLSIPKHVKRMMRGFKGRCSAYREAVRGTDPDSLTKVLARNVYGTVVSPDKTAVDELAFYVRANIEHLDDVPWDEIRAGSVTFRPAETYEGIYEGAYEQENAKKSGAGMVA